MFDSFVIFIEACTSQVSEREIFSESIRTSQLCSVYFISLPVDGTVVYYCHWGRYKQFYRLVTILIIFSFLRSLLTIFFDTLIFWKELLLREINVENVFQIIRSYNRNWMALKDKTHTFINLFLFKFLLPSLRLLYIRLQ